MTIYDELVARGLIAQVTNEEEIKKLINEGKATFYIGFDCTADSLTAGHFMALTLMKRLQMAGNKPIALIGGGTTMIGDPSGRTDMRKMLTREDIDHNAECFKKQMERFIDFSDGKALMVNNADWLLNLNYVDLLREVGACFSVNNMLRAECYKQRMEKGLSFLEFNYMIMQSYDFYYMFQKYNCNLEFGGDDQWSNMLGGRELIRRKLGKEDAQAMTTLVPNLGVVGLGEGRGFVMADIPGIIEGAAEGVGLGLDFLRHIERTRVLLHVVDAASVEGRDPIADIEAITEELRSYSPQLAERPTIIVANKLDVLPPEERETITKKLKERFEPDIPVIPISAATGEGVKDMLETAYKMLETAPMDVMEFTPEISLEEYTSRIEELPYTVEKSEDEEGVYLVEGPRIEKMLGYTNLEDNKGFKFFQDFMVKNGIIKELKDLGIEEGDTVRVYGWEFEYLE